MCDPLTVAAIALTAGGTVMQSKARSDAQDRIQSIQSDTRQRNNKILDNAQEVQGDALSNFERSTFDDDSGQQSESIENRLLSSLSEGFAGIGNSRTPDIVRREDAKQSGQAREFSENFARSLAKLRGTEQNIFNQRQNLGRLGERTNLAQSLVRGNTSAMNTDASNVSASSPLGDLLVGVGQAGLAAGGTGGASGASKGPLPNGKMSAGLGTKPPVPLKFR